MSAPQAKAERSAAKDARQMPAPDGPSTGKRKKKVARPFVIESRLRDDVSRGSVFRQLVDEGWQRERSYAKCRDADINLDKLRRSRMAEYFEYRMRTEG